IRLGEHGFALVVAPGGELIAHGDPDKKALIARSRNLSNHPLVQAARAAGGPTPVWSEYTDDGIRKLGVGTRLTSLGWPVIVEQPAAEAYASATRLRAQLVIAISVALLVMVAAGYGFGRSFIRPIHTLQRGTQAVAAGELEARVDIQTGDE